MRLAVALLVVAAAPARAGTLEAGGFVGVGAFGDAELGNSWAPDQTPGTAPALGGRLAWWLAPAAWRGGDLALDLGVEGEASITLSSTDSMAAAGRASYAAPVLGAGAHALLRLDTGTAVSPHLLLGAGTDTMLTRSPFASDDTDPVAYWGGGASWRLGRRLDLRIDLRHGLVAGRAHAVTSTFAFTAGLSVPLGARPATGVVAPGRAPDGPIAVDDDPDGDGVRGAADRCPDQAETVDGIDDADGCPEAPRDPDDDGDGVAASHDACPAQAEDRDGFQDADGCPEPDNDGDGLDDRIDGCPDQPETANGLDDGDGCPDTLPPAIAAIEGPIAVGFERGKARLTRGDKRALDAIAAVLRQAPTIRVRIDGGPGPGVDAALVRRRLDAIKWYLVDRGIAADRIDDAIGTTAGIALHVAASK